MRRGSVAAGLAVAAAGAVALSRVRRRAGERVLIRYDDGATVTLETASAERDALLARALEAIAAVRA